MEDGQVRMLYLCNISKITVNWSDVNC